MQRTVLFYQISNTVDVLQRNGPIVKTQPIATGGQSEERDTDSDQTPGKPPPFAHFADIIDDEKHDKHGEGAAKIGNGIGKFCHSQGSADGQQEITAVGCCNAAKQRQEQTVFLFIKKEIRNTKQNRQERNDSVYDR